MLILTIGPFGKGRHLIVPRSLPFLLEAFHLLLQTIVRDQRVSLLLKLGLKIRYRHIRG